MVNRLVHADAERRGDQHRVRVTGPNPTQWGPMPYRDSIQTMKSYVRAHGFPVQLDTTLEDGSVIALGFTPDGRVEDIGTIRQAAQRPDGGLGAAWTGPRPPSPEPAGVAARRPRHHEVPGSESDPHRPVRGERVVAPADNYGPDIRSETWGAPVDVAPIQIGSRDEAATGQPRAESRRERRDRERAAQQAEEASFSHQRVGLPPLDSPAPRGAAAKVREWAENLTGRSIAVAGSGIALVSGGVYFLFETGVLGA